MASSSDFVAERRFPGIAFGIQSVDAQVHRNLGLVLDEQGKLSEAAGQFAEAARLAPYDPQIRLSLGMALAKQGKREEAIAQYNEALRLKPDFLQAQQELRNLAAPR